LHRPSVGCSRTRRAATFFLDESELMRERQPPGPVSRLTASAVDGRCASWMQSNKQNSSIALSQFDHPTPCLSVLGLSVDLQESVVTKNHADIILKTGYFSVAVMVFLFISMFLLTTLHP
jgi:hypothetical protein